MDALTDEELELQALAADPDAGVAADAMPFTASGDDATLLPDWYMPPPMGGAAPRRGWRRRVAIAVIVSFVLIDAAGLCSTYGAIVAA